MIRGKTIPLCKCALPFYDMVEKRHIEVLCFLTFRIVRVISQIEGVEPTYKIVVKSEYILKACKDVIQSWPGISWNSDPLEVRIYI
jgi:hypothetical protein